MKERREREVKKRKRSKEDGVGWGGKEDVKGEVVDRREEIRREYIE